MLVFGDLFWDDEKSILMICTIKSFPQKCLTRISLSNLIQVVSTKIDLLKGFHLQLPVAPIKHGVLGFCWVNNSLSHIGGIKECQYFWCFWVISTLLVHSLGWHYNKPLCSHCNLKPASLMGFFIVGFARPPRSGFIKLWKTPTCDPVLTIRGHEDRWVLGWVLVGGERCLGRVLGYQKNQQNDFEPAS